MYVVFSPDDSRAYCLFESELDAEIYYDVAVNSLSNAARVYLTEIKKVSRKVSQDVAQPITTVEDRH